MLTHYGIRRCGSCGQLLALEACSCTRCCQPVPRMALADAGGMRVLPVLVDEPQESNWGLFPKPEPREVEMRKALDEMLEIVWVAGSGPHRNVTVTEVGSYRLVATSNTWRTYHRQASGYLSPRVRETGHDLQSNQQSAEQWVRTQLGLSIVNH